MAKKKKAKKKKAVKSKQEAEDFYVGIKEPAAVRRSLLESSKSFVESLQRYENFKRIREEKAAEIMRFKDDVRDINSLMGELKKILPKTKLKESIPKSIKVDKPAKAKKSSKKTSVKKSKPQPMPKKMPKVPSEKSGLEKLEAELGDIEAKLSKLQ